MLTVTGVCVLLSQPIFLFATYSQECLAVNFDNIETEQKCHILYFPINGEQIEPQVMKLM